MLSTIGGREAGRETGPQSGLNKAGVRGLCLHAHVDPPLDVDSPERGNDPGEYWQPQQLGDKSLVLERTLEVHHNASYRRTKGSTVGKLCTNWRGPQSWMEERTQKQGKCV